jgi:hypothetical protein
VGTVGAGGAMVNPAVGVSNLNGRKAGKTIGALTEDVLTDDVLTEDAGVVTMGARGKPVTDGKPVTCGKVIVGVFSGNANVTVLGGLRVLFGEVRIERGTTVAFDIGGTGVGITCDTCDTCEVGSGAICEVDVELVDLADVGKLKVGDVDGKPDENLTVDDVGKFTDPDTTDGAITPKVLIDFCGMITFDEGLEIGAVFTLLTGLNTGTLGT